MYPFFFGLSSCDATEDETMVIIEIDTSNIDESNFYPDDDFIWHMQKQQGQLAESMNIPEQLALAGELIKYNQKLWRNSLDCLGTIAHLGFIETKHIKRTATINFKNMNSQGRMCMHGWADVNIAPIAIAIRNPWLQNQIAWVFGDADSLKTLEMHPEQEKIKHVQQELNETRDKHITIIEY
jgi:hypothetical protein